MEFICRFYHIFQGDSNKNLHFPPIKHCPNFFEITWRRKSVDLSPKSFFWTSKQLFAIHFLLATCNVCPLAIPEFFAQTRVSDYWFRFTLSVYNMLFTLFISEIVGLVARSLFTLTINVYITANVCLYLCF